MSTTSPTSPEAHIPGGDGVPEGIAPDVWKLAGNAMGSPDMNRDILRRRVANAITADRASRPSRPDHEALIERLREMARQRLSTEMDREDRERAAFDDGYDRLVCLSRECLARALSSLQPPAPAPLEQRGRDLWARQQALNTEWHAYWLDKHNADGDALAAEKENDNAILP